MKFIERTVPPRSVWSLEQHGIHPLLARLFAARGITSADELQEGLVHLIPPTAMRGLSAAAQLLATAIEANKKMIVVADYDCDGATSCAVALRGLAMLGATQVDFVVPDRQKDGYGLTPSIAARVAQLGADVLITVDNGIASVEGVAAAQQLGMQVLVTDHHLPGSVLPMADVIVNPNQPGCEFMSKHMAGVGVFFYVLLALRALLRDRGKWAAQAEPRLDKLLPIVALGTVADVVRLDAQNRCLVAQGLARIRKGHMPPGIQALFDISGRRYQDASTVDLGFSIGPRINAAGRLADMTLGITCLLTDDPHIAQACAKELHTINATRKEVEANMRESAMALVEGLVDVNEEVPHAVTIFDPDFHEGVVGIVASKLKEQLHRPIFVFAQSQHEGELKGSGRSIAGFHLRDALDLIAKRHDGIIKRFGGHAMAAGCSIDADRIDEFEMAFIEVAKEGIHRDALTKILETDSSLPTAYWRVDLADLLAEKVWGQGFAPPLFAQTFQVINQRLLGEKHLGMRLQYDDQRIDAVWFGHDTPLPETATLAFRMAVDEWKGQRWLKLFIEACAD